MRGRVHLSALFLAVGLSSSLALGQTQFAELSGPHLPKDSDETFAMALGDVDGDGDLDLVFGNSVSQNRLYLNDGKGKFTDATAARWPGRGWSNAVSLGDVDGDGDLDLVLATHGQNRLYLNEGKGKLNDATASRLPKDVDLTKAMGLRDVDGDGDLDLVFGNEVFGNGGQNRLYLNDGKGKFTDATASRLPKEIDSTNAVGLGDVDGDGDLDLVFGNLVFGNSAQNRLYLNLHRHIHAPFLATIGRNYQVDFYAKPGYASVTQFAIPFVNVAPAVPAIKLPPLGTIGVSTVGLVMLPRVSLPAPAGKATIQIAIPAWPALVGLTPYIQALMVHRITPPEAHFTNVVADRIIKWNREIGSKRWLEDGTIQRDTFGS